jgi:hypothetical protein
MNAEEIWSKIKEQFLKLDDDVEKMGHSLKIKKKMFTFLNKGHLVVKLPKERVQELLNSGEGLPYDPGSGKIMMEWVIIPFEKSDIARLYKRSNEICRNISKIKQASYYDFNFA